jgi:hypothetical protein
MARMTMAAAVNENEHCNINGKYFDTMKILITSSTMQLNAAKLNLYH